MIWEDRKFADIGMVMVRQIKNHISTRADIVSVHSIAGLESVKTLDFISIFLIAELSSKGCLTDSNYIIRSTIISEELDNVIGIVCQHKIKCGKLMVVPGISLKKSEDGMGQQHDCIDFLQRGLLIYMLLEEEYFNLKIKKNYTRFNR